MSAAATFAAVGITLYAAHSVADHWVQTQRQAAGKAARSRAGQLADLAHVATYTATLAIALLVVDWRLGLDLDPARVGVALALNGATHYWADRRAYLIALARSLGKGPWIDADPGAAYQLDQSWHLGWLFVTALIIT